MNIIKDCWQGHCPLGQVLWGYYIGLSFALLFVFGLVFSILPDSLQAVFALTFVAFLLMYQVWALVSVWRCAKNSQRWRSLARFWVALMVVGFPIRVAINYPHYADYVAARHQSPSAR